MTKNDIDKIKIIKDFGVNEYKQFNKYYSKKEESKRAKKNLELKNFNSNNTPKINKKNFLISIFKNKHWLFFN
jgi:hypothetical protein